MNFDEIRALLAVAEYGSFVAAARETAQTRTTLRRRVDELEARLGTLLVDRTAHGARLTPAGELVCAEGREVLARARSLQITANTIGSAPAAPLHVVVPHGLPPELVAMTFEGLAGRFPELELALSFSENPRAAIIDDADLVVTMDGDSADGPWDRLVLCRLEEWLVASPAYVERHGAPATPGDLAKHRVVTWKRPRADANNRLPLRSGGYVDIEPILVTSDVHVLRHIAAAGNAIAYVPDARLGAFAPAQPDLVPLLGDVVGRASTLDLLAPRALSGTPRVKALLDFVQELLAMVREPSAEPSADSAVRPSVPIDHRAVAAAAPSAIVKEGLTPADAPVAARGGAKRAAARAR